MTCGARFSPVTDMGHQLSSGLYNCAGHGRRLAPAPFNTHGSVAQGHGSQGFGEAAGPHDGGHLQLALRVLSNLLQLEASMTRAVGEHCDMPRVAVHVIEMEVKN